MVLKPNRVSRDVGTAKPVSRKWVRASAFISMALMVAGLAAGCTQPVADEIVVEPEPSVEEPAMVAEAEESAEAEPSVGEPAVWSEARVGVAADPSWVEPAWMAEARLGVEEYHAAMLSCLAEFGVVGIAAPGGHVGTGGRTDEDGVRIDAQGRSPAELQRLENQATRECQDRHPYPAHWTSTATEADYERTLQVRECLLAHGLQVQEPPPLEIWLISRWNPWRSAFSDNGLGPAEVDHFMAACPQTGIHNVGIIFGERL